MTSKVAQEIQNEMVRLDLALKDAFENLEVADRNDVHSASELIADIREMQTQINSLKRLYQEMGYV